MTEKEIIKYLEIVFNDITDFELVSVNNPITKVLKHETKEERDKFFSVVDNVKLFAKNNDLIEKHGTGDFFKLTKNGKQLKKIGSYSEYLKYIEKKELDNNGLNINIENLINGDNNGIQSSGNIELKSPFKQKIVNKIAKEPSKKPWIEITSWVIGSIVGLIAIYEFVIKKLLAE
jgi:hypothetical protein